MLYISPDGKKFDTPQAVFKYLGAAGGVTRAEAAAKSQAYKNDNPCPFTLKVQQGQLTVQQLGNLMVEKGLPFLKLKMAREFLVFLNLLQTIFIKNLAIALMGHGCFLQTLII